MDDGHKSRLNYKQNYKQNGGKTTQRDRLRTFSPWRLSHPDPYVLSKLGFCFTGKADQVKCCECSRTIDNWKDKANPLLEHYKVNNGCVFVQNYREVLFTFRIKADIISKSTMNNIYVSVEYRVFSFKGVHLPVFLSVESLAHAGFYYLGPGDRVKCHCCGIILVEWETIDIPIAEHYRWSVDCDYIQQCLPKLNYDIDSALKIELGIDLQVSPEITSECETGDFDLTNRESCSFSISRNFNENRLTNQSSTNSGLNVLLNLSPNRMVRECESLKVPIQEGRNDRYRTIPESEVYNECEVYDECENDKDELTKISTSEKIESNPSNDVEEPGNDEDELTKILTSAKVEAAKEIFGFPSYVIEEFVRRYYKQHHKDFDSAAHLCSVLTEEQEQDHGTEMCDSSASKKAKTLSDTSNFNEPKTPKPLVTKTSTNTPTTKTVDRTGKEERFVSSFDSKLSLNSETYVPCKICLDKEVQVTFIPCRHLVTCEECSNLVEICPICRKHIRDRMKIYLS